MNRRKTVLHIITGIDVGGAEFMLARTIEHADHGLYRHLVVSLKNRGDLARHIESAGAAALICLDIRGPLSGIRGFLRLCRLIRREEPAAVQTWLAHATLFGSLASLAAGNRRILWCLHTGNQAPSRVALSVRLINRVLGLLSRIAPRVIVSVSQAASEHGIRLGFPRSRIRLIPNGTDAETFRPDPGSGVSFRFSQGIPANAPVVGIVGRNTREKDFRTFFQAALRLQRVLPQTHFILCGKGLAPSMPEAADSLPLSAAPHQFHFVGVRNDMPRVYNACNLVVLTSVSEAFPLVLGEAMACGVPVAATDVGDCRSLIGEAGRTAPAGQPEAIAASWEQVLTLPPYKTAVLSKRARQRILDHFAIRPCIQRYELIYDELSFPPVKAPRLDRKPSPVTPNPVA